MMSAAITKATNVHMQQALSSHGYKYLRDGKAMRTHHANTWILKEMGRKKRYLPVLKETDR